MVSLSDKWLICIHASMHVHRMLGIQDKNNYTSVIQVTYQLDQRDEEEKYLRKFTQGISTHVLKLGIYK